MVVEEVVVVVVDTLGGNADHESTTFLPFEAVVVVVVAGLLLGPHMSLTGDIWSEGVPPPAFVLLPNPSSNQPNPFSVNNTMLPTFNYTSPTYTIIHTTITPRSPHTRLYTQLTLLVVHIHDYTHNNHSSSSTYTIIHNYHSS